MGKLAIACLTLMFVCIPLSDGRRCPSCRSDQGSGCERLAETCVECGDFSCTKGEIKTDSQTIEFRGCGGTTLSCSGSSLCSSSMSTDSTNICDSSGIQDIDIRFRFGGSASPLPVGVNYVLMVVGILSTCLGIFA